ncbi:DUF2663 family protein [Schinkia sp. CFF1]
MENMRLYLDEVGQVIIQDLCKLKTKYEKKESELKLLRMMMLISAAIFIGYVLIFTVLPFRFQYGVMISRLINDGYHYLFIAVLVTLHFRFRFIEKKAEKLEKEYNALRCEVIQRSEELWPEGEKRAKRHHFFKLMKEKYKINLYYEND